MTPEHIIDLRLPPEQRWVAYGRENRSLIRRLLARAQEEAADQGPIGALKVGFGLLARLYADHPYHRELVGFADAVGVDVATMYVANVAYDIFSVKMAIQGPIGCTSVIHGGPPAPMISRNMDWVFPTGIGKHSCVFRFVDDHDEYLSVGFPGITGVVSAISSTGVALTVNQAPHRTLPSFRALPTLWLTRLAMDQASDFRSAKKVLTTNASAASAYILLAGTKPGEAARIINRGYSDDVTKVGAGRYAVVANHEPGEEQEYEAEEGDSYDRCLRLEERAAAVAAGDVAAAKRSLSKWPVMHGDTVHQMVLLPGTGELHLRCPHRGEQTYSTFRVGARSI